MSGNPFALLGDENDEPVVAPKPAATPKPTDAKADGKKDAHGA